MLLMRVLVSVMSLLSVLLAEQKYRLCVVQISNNTRRINKYCPLLKEAASKAECVIGNSRLDCLRLLTKNKADFAVFEAEDIIVADDKIDDLVITNEVRLFEKSKFEYEVVAVVRKNSGITSLSHLKGKNLCHPGYGYETDWSEVMAKFFEARVVPQQCDTSLTLEENYIKSSSEFFNAACKAGPWVPNSKLDSELKTKYPNMCQLCDIPLQCSTLDKYWGRTGPLYCLTDGQGDVVWARLDDIKYHFGFIPGIHPAASPSDYSFLCVDGSLASLDNPQENCLWLARPWPAIISRSSSAEGVKKMVSLLKGSSVGASWKLALQHLLSSSQMYLPPLDNTLVPQDYLSRAQGFLSANNMVHCDLHRVMRICTSSNIEKAKCSWLRDAALAYGVEPKVLCVRFRSIEDCIKAVNDNTADVVTLKTDSEAYTRRQFGLKPLMYEFTSHSENVYNVAAVVKASSSIKSLEDLKGKRACFTTYNGVGWNTMILHLKNKLLLPLSCPYTRALGEFFSEGCVPGLNGSGIPQQNLQALCRGEEEYEFGGEIGALKCLAVNKGDVAFIALTTILENTDGQNNESWAQGLKSRDFRPLCIDNDVKNCYLSWATLGQIMVKSTISPMRSRELSTTFQQLSTLFGKHYKTRLPTFLLFGEYDGQNNIMFQDLSEKFEYYELLPLVSKKPRNYEHMVGKLPPCSTAASAASATIFTTAVLLWALILH